MYRSSWLPVGFLCDCWTFQFTNKACFSYKLLEIWILRRCPKVYINLYFKIDFNWKGFSREKWGWMFCLGAPETFRWVYSFEWRDLLLQVRIFTLNKITCLVIRRHSKSEILSLEWNTWFRLVVFSINSEEKGNNKQFFLVTERYTVCIATQFEI